MENKRLAPDFFRIIELLLMIGLLSACGETTEIVVRGDLRGSDTFLEGKRVFLENAETRYFVDTTVVHGGKFEFKIDTQKDFIPFRAAIYFETGNPEWPRQLIGYRNPYFKKTGEVNFYAERGLMELQLDTIRVFTPKNTEVMFNIKDVNRQTSTLFHHYSLKAGARNVAANRAYNRSLIERHPYSLDLLRNLNFSKAALQPNEAKELLALFDPQLHTNPVYITLQKYAMVENKTGKDFPATVALKTADDRLYDEALLDPTKHNLVVFWASWCGPCRMEIPQIKKLYERSNAKLNIVSISVDKDQDAWKGAMQKEQMPWKQFLLPAGETYAMLDKKYNLETIPVWVLLDHKGKMIEQHVGYDTGENAMDLKVAKLLK